MTYLQYNNCSFVYCVGGAGEGINIAGCTGQTETVAVNGVGDRDLLTCGGCRTEFLLSDIIQFICHKSSCCKTSAGNCAADRSTTTDDDDSDSNENNGTVAASKQNGGGDVESTSATTSNCVSQSNKGSSSTTRSSVVVGPCCDSSLPDDDSLPSRATGDGSARSNGKSAAKDARLHSTEGKLMSVVHFAVPCN